MGGTDDPSNLIELTIEEHAEAHRKLYEKYGNKFDKVAWLSLSQQIGQEEIIYEVLSEAGKRGGSKRKGKEPWNKGKKGVQKNPYLAELNRSRRGQPVSEETKAKVSAANSGRKRPDLAERNKKRKGMNIPRDESGRFVSNK